MKSLEQQIHFFIKFNSKISAMQDFVIDPNIAQAKTISTDFYLSQEVYERSKEKIFAAGFQYIGTSELVPEPGSTYPFVLSEGYLNEPLLLTKGKDEQLYCLSNVCTHRGNILIHEPCKISRLTCKYHGRQFGMDGKFLSMPQFTEVENFPSEADNLHQLPIFKFGNLLFTSLNREAKSEEFFGEMMERMAWYPMEDLQYRPDLSKEFVVKANWALYCENYLEGFHIPFVHKGLNEVLDFNKYTTEIFRNSNLQIGIAKEGEASFDLPFTSPDNGKNVAAYYFWVFPNMMFNFYPWGLSLNIIQPISVNETKVNFYSFVLDESKFGHGAGSNLDTVEMEDEEVVEQVQIGIRSRFYTHGRYSVTREQGTHHFHSLLAQFIS